MVQRRLNRKVALIGFAVIAFLLLLIIGVILHLGQDPKEFIRDAEVALKAAREATDTQTKEQNYQRAGHSFREAFDRAGTDSLREDILLKMLDMYSETGEWNYILRCWEGLIKVNPNNAKARYGRLQYFYSLADSGDHGFWQQVKEQASEFLKVAQDAGLLGEETAQWNVSGLERKVTGPQLLGPQLYLLRARAAFEMARLGAVTNQDEVLEQAVTDLKKVQELEPGSIDAYWYLSQAAVTRGEIFASRGDFEERDKASSQALALLEQAVEIAGDSPRAHINLLTLKLALAGTGTAEMLKERIQSIEPEYLSLIERFGSSAEAFAAVSNFYGVYSIYSGPLLGAGNLDRAIETAEQAAGLDKGNVAHVLDLANFHNRRYCLYESEPDADKAIAIAKAALALPDAQDTPGPRRQANRNNRYNLYALLANCYIERILENREQAAESKTREWTAGAEQAVHEIEQLVGSAEDPRVRRWQGMLELAKGNEDTAVNELYAAYKQIKSIKPPEPPWPPDPEFAQLSYTLATIFKDTPEIGAAHEFLISALLSRIGWIKPDASLDYVEVLLKFGHYSDAIQNIDAYEGRSGSNQRSQELRIKAHIGTQQFAEAEAELAKRPENEPDTIKLRLELIRARIRYIQLAIAQKKTQETSAPAPRQTTPDSADSQAGTEQFMTEELKNYTQLEADLLEKLLPTGLDYSEQLSVINACRNYIVQGQTALAGRLIDRFLDHFPDNAAALVYKQILSEPAPLEVSQQRRREIEKQALSSIADPTRKAVQLGVYHHRYNELDKAVEHLKEALETPAPSQGQIADRLTLEQLQLAASHLLDIAAETKDWELAEQVAKKARQGNLDSCQGQIFATRLAMAKGDLKDALARVDDCLKHKPIFSYAYMLRSQINAALGNEHASMEDIHRAASMNPLDGTVARGLAAMLYRRNQKLGGNVSTSQVTEARDALEKAVALNPRDLALLGLYADYIAPTEPLRAVAMRQDLQKAQPSVENALSLGMLATEAAANETNQASKEALYAVAGSAFEQARQIDPSDRRMLYRYAEYLRARGQGDQAKKLLQESQDEQLLWDHYYQAGQYADARRVLERLYQSGTKDGTVLRGLMFVAEKLFDKEAVHKYSEELTKAEDSAENNLAQIRTFLRVGLIKEAEHKLQSFKEKYPNEPRILLLQAWLVMRQGQLDKALELANRNLQSNPDNPTAWRLKGEINFFRGDYDSAVDDLKKSKLLSDEPATRVSLAKAYLQMKRHDDAVTELKNAIDVPGAPPEARSLLEHIYFQLHRKQALTRFYEETLEKFPDSVHWLNQAGAFAIKTGEFDKAEHLYKKALDAGRKPHEQGEIHDAPYGTALDGYLKALIAVAGTPNTKGWNPARLEMVFQEGGKYTDTAFAPSAYLRMAQAKSALGDRTAAIEYCRRAVDKAGADQKLASEALHKMYLMLGAEEVSKYCEQKLAGDPDSLAANFTMFSLAEINGDYDTAVDYIDKCVRLTEPDSPARVAYAMRKGGLLISAYGKSSDNKYLKMAIADYESLLAKTPTNIGVATVLNNLAYLLAESNERLDEALQYAGKALDAKPNDPGVLDTYAYVLLKNGKTSQAAEFLTAALQQYQQDRIAVPAEIYEHEGMIKEKLGTKTEALAAYKQALEAGAETLPPKARQRIERAIERVSQ